MDDHNAAVAAIAADVRRFHQRQQPFRIYHGATNSTRESPYDRNNIVSTRHLHHVLQVDLDKKTVLVEPNVPMDQLVAATLRQGLVPLVVMEFPGITAGGGFSGTSGESSSFRHGFFDATVTRIEIVLPNGDVRTASPTDADPDLFWGAASTLGTLGVVTMLEIQCRPAKPYVALTYLPASSMAQAMQLVRKASADPATEYLDGIVYAHDHIVICAGRLADLPSAGDPQPYRVQRLSRPHDPWFYLHAQRRALRGHDTARTGADYVPLQDYLFRYDRGAFWTGRYAFRYFITPFNRITRYVLDCFMHTRVMYRALHASGLSHQFVIQDVAVPYRATAEFLYWLQQGTNFNAYPIWLCPLRVTQSKGGLMLGPSPGNTENEEKGEDEGYLMNFGLWAPSPFRRKSPEFVAQNRRLEQKVHELGGRKWLYAHAYYTEDEFWAIYDKGQYDRLRKRFHAAYLPDLYHKVRVNLAPEGNRGWMGMLWEIWPIRGLYGVYKACRGGDYLIRKQS
ncbi:hypothetical protein BJX96DRAFT_177782 [Aspergillus floccosus]